MITKIFFDFATGIKWDLFGLMILQLVFCCGGCYRSCYNWFPAVDDEHWATVTKDWHCFRAKIFQRVSCYFHFGFLRMQRLQRGYNYHWIWPRLKWYEACKKFWPNFLLEVQKMSKIVQRKQNFTTLGKYSTKIQQFLDAASAAVGEQLSLQTRVERFCSTHSP